MESEPFKDSTSREAQPEVLIDGEVIPGDLRPIARDRRLDGDRKVAMARLFRSGNPGTEVRIGRVPRVQGDGAM